MASSGGRVPVIAGVAEYSAAFGATFAHEAERIGVDGLMVMPAMVYSAKPRETIEHFRTIASASDLPIMIYNNPPIYRTDVTPPMLQQLADVDTIVAFKESSGDTRRFVDIRNLLGDRYIPFCGLDDVVLESVALGAVGWVSGPLQRLSARGRDAVPTGGGGQARRGDDDLRVVHAAAAP